MEIVKKSLKTAEHFTEENIKGVSQLKCLETVHKSGLKKFANQTWYKKMAIAFKLTKNPSQNMLECLYGAETVY